jgi:hypothetical protein
MYDAVRHASLAAEVKVSTWNTVLSNAEGYRHLFGSLVLGYFEGRAIAQAVSRRFPTAEARVRTQVRACGIYGGQSGAWADFLRVLRFPLPVLIPLIASHSFLSIFRGWYSRPNSGRRTKWTQSHPTPRK